MNIALVLAGGTGTRLGTDIPKQYIRVNGRMIIDYCLETMEHSKDIDEVWIVAGKCGSSTLGKLINLRDMHVRVVTGSYPYIMGLGQLKLHYRMSRKMLMFLFMMQQDRF